MSDFVMRVGDRLPAILSTLTDGAGTPLDLTEALSVRFIMRAMDGVAPILDAAADVIGDPPLGQVRYSWAAGDTAVAGAYFAEWQVTFSDSRRLTVPNDEAISIQAVPGVATMPAITAGDLAAIRRHIGDAQPPMDADLALALARLGSTDAVAIEILEGRYARMISSPGKWAVEGDFNLDNTVNIKALAAKLADLQTSAGTGAGIPVAHLTRSDPWR
ncbi:MAG: hypothetical protein LC798_16725 [Chloroflexi bacterium]|nr:hypothetical protein [Chloroflexota bacterium]